MFINWEYIHVGLCAHTSTIDHYAIRYSNTTIAVGNDLLIPILSSNRLFPIDVRALTNFVRMALSDYRRVVLLSHTFVSATYCWSMGLLSNNSHDLSDPYL